MEIQAENRAMQAEAAQQLQAGINAAQDADLPTIMSALTKKGRNLLNKRFLDKEDEHGILKENTGLDNLFGRDPMQYMRLRGTEKSFFIHQKCCELHIQLREACRFLHNKSKRLVG